MKNKAWKSPLERYMNNRLDQAASEDRLFILAKELVNAKDERGENLFWDSDEEDFMRTFLEYTEETSC